MNTKKLGRQSAGPDSITPATQKKIAPPISVYRGWSPSQAYRTWSALSSRGRGQAIEDLYRYKEALERIAKGNPASPGQWLTDSQMAEIAREALSNKRGVVNLGDVAEQVWEDNLKES